MRSNTNTPIQQKLMSSVSEIPVEFFKWGKYPDHFKIDMPHRHAFSELLFFTKGGGVHEIDFSDFDIQTCSIHYIPKEKIHFLKRDKYSDGYTIAFDTGYLENNNTHRIVTPFSYEAFVLNLNEGQFAKVKSITDILKSQIFGEEGYYKSKCFLSSLELLLNTVASLKEKNEKFRPKNDDLLRTFKYLVQSNLRERCDIAWYADQMSISKKSLVRHVQSELNINPKEYVIETLVKDIKRSLVDTSKSIKDIVADYCYSPSQLHNQFKRKVGYTMSEYRSYKSE